MKQIVLKKFIMIFFIIVAILGLGYGISHAIFQSASDNESVFNVSSIQFGINTPVDNIKIQNIVPTLDKFGILEDSYDFTIQNNTEEEKDYVLKLVDGNVVSSISNSVIRYEITIDDKVMGIYNLNEGGIIDSGRLLGGEDRHYAIKFWLDYNSEEKSGIWQKIVSVTIGSANLDTSGANAPVLTDGMIPVYYDEQNEVWRKADQKNVEQSYKWYDYNDFMWANAVTVAVEKRSLYQNASNGIIIAMDDINSMWVWIPRYKYTIFNNDFKNTTSEEIEITFESGTKSSGSVQCIEKFSDNVSEECSDILNGKVTNFQSTYTHPAFTFNGEDLVGFWVSKFEAGVDETSSCAIKMDAENCNKNNIDIYIKPNMKSLGSITLSNLFTNFRRMELKDNIYGFKNSGTTLNGDGSIVNDTNQLDIHLIKNSEWGSISYLYHSKYGKYANPMYANSEREIYHNASDYTGHSMGSSSVSGDDYLYNVLKYGTGASTTGNIYGVFDMVGGHGEFVMTNFNDEIGNFDIDESTSFTEPILRCYYDQYNINSNNLSVTNLGDGLKETLWYNDSKNLSIKYLLYRGGTASVVEEGIFSINYITGKTAQNIGGRPVLNISSDVYMNEW